MTCLVTKLARPRRPETVALRLSVEDKRKLNDLIRARGANASQVIRDLIVQAHGGARWARGNPTTNKENGR
jgi:hypothetical protein